MKLTLQNDQLEIIIDTKGAELQKIWSKKHSTDYLWNGDSAYWGKHSPILFPIVGQLKENTYYYKGKAYTLPRHGFARDMEFEAESHTDTNAVLTLKSTEETRRNYPFDFMLKIHYTITGHSLEVGYEVIHTGSGMMYFSIGGHPAFALPLEQGLQYNDYKIYFNEVEHTPRWLIEDGLLSDAVPFFDNTSILPLTKELFYNDALVFQHLHSTSVVLDSNKGNRHLQFNIANFPYLGIWAARDAPFVCIEPWCGIADYVDHNQQLTEKEGIIALEAGTSWKRSWDISMQ